MLNISSNCMQSRADHGTLYFRSLYTFLFCFHLCAHWPVKCFVFVIDTVSCSYFNVLLSTNTRASNTVQFQNNFNVHTRMEFVHNVHLARKRRLCFIPFEDIIHTDNQTKTTEEKRNHNLADQII